MQEKFEKAKKLLEKYNQEHLLSFYKDLTSQEKEALLEQIFNTDFDMVDKLYASTKKELEIKQDKIEPMSYIDKEKLTKEEKNEYIKIGENAISSGKYAIATMAGGQGTRLRTLCT